MGRNTQICGKLENHAVGHEIWPNRKMWKMREKHCRAWNMARKLKIMENEIHTL
jgi:hypothetical protein